MQRSEDTNKHARLIEVPARSFKVVGKIVPWVWRTFYRDLGLRGISDLLRHFWAEANFDRRYGVRTEYRVPQQDLDFEDKDAQKKSARYRSTPPFNISTSLKRLSERLGGLQDQALVDYGCGTGRVLILAVEAGIKDVVGMELSPHLVQQGRENLKAYSLKSQTNAKMQILQEDATTFVPAPNSTIFYFFAPFHSEVFDLVLDCIRQSVREYPRDIYVMLFMCSHFETKGLELVGQVVNVQTLTNALDRDAFVAVNSTTMNEEKSEK